jgi:hypothetical protein
MPDDALPLGPEELSKIVEKKATCPFVGTAVVTGQLPVDNGAANPLATIEDVRGLGNTGGGDLGDFLVLFATGNHGFMRGPDDQLNQKVPDGLARGRAKDLPLGVLGSATRVRHQSTSQTPSHARHRSRRQQGRLGTSRNPPYEMGRLPIRPRCGHLRF